MTMIRLQLNVKERKRLPLELQGTEGIYVYTDKDNNILYIGRSYNLRQRLSDHRRKGGIESLIPEAENLFVMNCNNSKEKEREAIRAYAPKYNGKGLTCYCGLS